MATLQQTTASNLPRINPDQREQAEELLAEWDFASGAFGSPTVTITDDEEPRLSCHALDGPFEPYPADEVEHPAEYREHVDHERFLSELSDFLLEPFVVQTVGNEKARFPLVAYQWAVTPDGEIDHQTLEFHEFIENT